MHLGEKDHLQVCVCVKGEGGGVSAWSRVELVCQYIYYWYILEILFSFLWSFNHKSDTEKVSYILSP